jgi:hypothetical protein
LAAVLQKQPLVDAIGKSIEAFVMQIINVKSLMALTVCLLAVAVAWVLFSIFGYGMTFDRTELDGINKGMSRVEVVSELKKRGVVELEAIPDEGTNASKGADAQGGYWVRFNDKDYDSEIRRHDTWRYQIPNSYSNADIVFKGNDLISIKYRWRPFEG